jgi:hypothetical protein
MAELQDELRTKTDLLLQARQMLEKQRSDFAVGAAGTAGRSGDNCVCSSIFGSSTLSDTAQSFNDVTCASPQHLSSVSLPSSGNKADNDVPSSCNDCDTAEKRESWLLQQSIIYQHQQQQLMKQKTRPRSATGQLSGGRGDIRLLRQDSEPLHLLRNNVQRTVKARLDQSPPSSSAMTPPTRKKSIVSEVFTHLIPAKFASLTSVLSSPKSSIRGPSGGRSFRAQYRRAAPLSSSVYNSVSAATTGVQGLKLSKTGPLSQSQPQISSFSSSSSTAPSPGGMSQSPDHQQSDNCSGTLSFGQYSQALSSVTEGNSSYCISQEAAASSSDDTAGTGSDHDHSPASIEVMADGRSLYMAEPEETDF